MSNTGLQSFGDQVDSSSAIRTPRFRTESAKGSARSEILGHLTDLVYFEAPLTEGLARAAMDSPGRKVRTILLSIRVWLLAGYPLSTALSKQSRLFPDYCIELVRSGEESGRLYEALQDLEEFIDDESSFRSEFTGYSAYLLSVLGIQVFLIWGMVVFVMPRFAKIFYDMGAELPESSQLLISVAQTTSWLWPILFLIIWASLFFGPDRVLRWLRLDNVAMRLPGLSSVRREKDLGHTASILGLLIGAGYPVSEALRFACQLNVNRRLLGALSRTQSLVESGVPAGVALKEQGKHIPDSLATIVSLGEQCGKTGQFLTSFAGQYRRVALRKARTILYVGATAAICLTGLFTMIAYTGIMMPVMNLSSIVGG